MPINYSRVLRTCRLKPIVFERVLLTIKALEGTNESDLSLSEMKKITYGRMVSIILIAAYFNTTTTKLLQICSECILTYSNQNTD